jgi:hypothetical protein
MEKIFLSAILMFITSVFALCQVKFDSFVTSNSTSSVTISPTGLTRLDLRVRLSKPSSQAASGKVSILGFTAGGSGFPLSTFSTISVNDGDNWSPDFNGRKILDLVFLGDVKPADLNNINTRIVAQYVPSAGASLFSSAIFVLIPLSNNVITPLLVSSFSGSGNPSVINASTPIGGTGSYSFNWQSSTTSSTAGFTNIANATSLTYDPPVINQTTYYRRVVLSGGVSITSNVITITIVPIGTSFDNPIDLGNLNIGSTYSSGTIQPRGYYYKLNLLSPATVRISTCRTDRIGVFNGSDLYDANRTLVRERKVWQECPSGDFFYNIAPGEYYIVTYGYPNASIAMDLYVRSVCPTITTSPDVIFQSNTVTTLTASGADSYKWYFLRPGEGGVPFFLGTGSSITAAVDDYIVFTVIALSNNGCSEYKYIYADVYIPAATDVVPDFGGRKATNESSTGKVDVPQSKEPNNSSSGVYPNPANQFISINLNDDAPSVIHIMNTNGVIVKEVIQIEKNIISNISDLPSGLYLVKIVQGNKIHSEKILIER